MSLTQGNTYEHWEAQLAAKVSWGSWQAGQELCPVWGSCWGSFLAGFLLQALSGAACYSHGR